METSDDVQGCGTCRNSRISMRRVNYTQQDAPIMECRKSTPDNSGWPSVQPGDWCAEYMSLKRKELRFP